MPGKHAAYVPAVPQEEHAKTSRHPLPTPCPQLVPSRVCGAHRCAQWETALRIFSEMQQDGCAPNTVTYNSLITACAQGEQGTCLLQQQQQQQQLHQHSCWMIQARDAQSSVLHRGWQRRWWRM